MPVKAIFAGLLFLGSISSAQSATLEQYGSGVATPTTIGSFEMTDFALTSAGGTTSSVVAPSGDILEFFNSSGGAANLMVSTANDPIAPLYTSGWWNNAETNPDGSSRDYNVFLTSSLHLVTIMLPTNTRAFSFNVGANMNAGGWLAATESTTGSNEILRTNFSAGPGNTPGYGIYADRGSCSSITSVTIDPTFLWGFGNFSINQSECSTSVPESNSLYLLLFGLLGLLFTARRNI